jgi:hypothetical protein
VAKFGPIANPRDYGYKVGDGGTIINTNTVMTLTRDLYTDFVTLSNGGSIKTNGYRIFSNGPVIGSNTGTIHNRGAAGGDGATPSVGGQGADPTNIGTLWCGHAGGDGANCLRTGGSADGCDGGGDLRFSGSPGIDGAGGPGGPGGAGSTRAPGSGPDNNWSTDENGSRFQWHFALHGMLFVPIAGGIVFPSGGGGGGGGGANDASNRAGGGGAGGGPVYISAPYIILNDSFSIDVSGGRGGIGTTDTSGGGGGQAGWIMLHTDSLTLNGTSKLNMVGGVGGAGNGTGVVGGEGGVGWAYIWSERGMQAFYQANVTAPQFLPDDV